MALNPCQPGKGASCAACCGLYTGLSTRAAVESRLRERFEAFVDKPTEAFAVSARAMAAARRSGEAVGGALGQCALAGFLDREGRRVGCLGHASVTGGRDCRDLGSFGAFTCEGFRCPSVGAATDDEIALARDGSDWFLYGLVITDLAFLRECLEAVRAAAGRALAPADLEDPGTCAAVRSLFALKERAAPFGDSAFHEPDLGPLARAVASAMCASR